jgi:hypothetical protein
MKKLLIVSILLASGIAQADCYSGAKAFADRINLLYKMDRSRDSIERHLRQAYSADNIVKIGSRYSAILANGEPKRGYTSSEYERFANEFARNACSK